MRLSFASESHQNTTRPIARNERVSISSTNTSTTTVTTATNTDSSTRPNTHPLTPSPVTMSTRFSHLNTNTTSSRPATTSSQSSSQPNTSMNLSSNKTRQYTHLHAQLAQLSAHLADTENIVRVTSAQAGDIRFLGGYVGALFMGSAKVLGEESVKGREKGQS